MKKLLLTSIVAFMALIFTACHSNDVEQQQKSNVTVDNQEAKDIIKSNIETSQQAINFDQELIIAERASEKAKEIPVGEENFQKLVSFIQKKGFVIDGGPKRIRCGHQYTFFDSKRNRYAFIAIKTDSAGEASIKGIVKSIFVYGYHMGISDQKHFFGWYIDSSRIHPNITDINGIWNDKDAATAKFGYEEFLKKVNN